MTMNSSAPAMPAAPPVQAPANPPADELDPTGRKEKSSDDEAPLPVDKSNQDDEPQTPA